MSMTFNFALRFLCGTLGILLVYASLSYEDEEGKIQSLLEKWWIRIDDLRHQAISSHIAFMKVMASLMTSFMDRLLGPRLRSFQSVGVSICYSIVWIGIGLFIMFRLHPPEGEVSDPVWAIGFGILYGSIPALIPKNAWQPPFISWVTIWFLVLLFIIFQNFISPMFNIIIISLTHAELRAGAVIFSAVIVGVAFSTFLFVNFLGIMRATLKTIARSESAIKIAGLTLLNAAPIVTIYGLFKLMLWSVGHYVGEFDFAMAILMLAILFCAILFNVAFILSAVLFVSLSVAMFVHRVAWRVIERPLYKLQALGIAKRPMVFRLIGLTLIGAAFGKHEWLWSIVEKL